MNLNKMKIGETVIANDDHEKAEKAGYKQDEKKQWGKFEHLNGKTYYFGLSATRPAGSTHTTWVAFVKENGETIKSSHPHPTIKEAIAEAGSHKTQLLLQGKK